MKKLINDPANVVIEALQGMALAHPELRIDMENRVVFRGDAPVSGKVGLISGGGSGHEPLHGGFVGPGMLDAACAGEVFTSPVPDQMLAATQGVNGGAGVLHIVKNYTGDVMNFEMAAELAAAEGIDVVAVVTDDDVAVQDSLYTAGRRGVGVTVLVEKIAGAAAQAGRSLTEVAEIAKLVNGTGRSMGMALTSCTVPAAGAPTFDLPDGEMEIGIGIHGEPGRRRVPLAPAREIAEMLVEPILSDLDFAGGDGVIAFVNGMGASPLLELYLMYGEVAAILSKHGITVARSLVGNYITSLDMAGCSVTVVKATDDLVTLWDAPVRTPGLRWGV
jgi:phosphoenolpyruvate---glycerone phosphotransferase subunit DhaK